MCVRDTVTEEWVPVQQQPVPVLRKVRGCRDPPSSADQKEVAWHCAFSVYNRLISECEDMLAAVVKVGKYFFFLEK